MSEKPLDFVNVTEPSLDHHFVDSIAKLTAKSVVAPVTSVKTPGGRMVYFKDDVREPKFIPDHLLKLNETGDTIKSLSGIIALVAQLCEGHYSNIVVALNESQILVTANGRPEKHVEDFETAYSLKPSETYGIINGGLSCHIDELLNKLRKTSLFKDVEGVKDIANMLLNSEIRQSKNSRENGATGTTAKTSTYVEINDEIEMLVPEQMTPSSQTENLGKIVEDENASAQHKLVTMQLKEIAVNVNFVDDSLCHAPVRVICGIDYDLPQKRMSIFPFGGAMQKVRDHWFLAARDFLHIMFRSENGFEDVLVVLNAPIVNHPEPERVDEPTV